MALNETFKASVIGQLQGSLTAVVFDYGYVDLNAGSTHRDTGTWAGVFQTMWQAVALAALTDDLVIKRYRFACVAGIHVGEIGYVDNVNVTGGLTAVNRMPNEVCVSLKRSTGYASRRDRGRVFWGPVATTLVDNSDVNLADVGSALLQAARDLGSTPITTGGASLTPVILAANGTYSGRVIVNTGIGDVLCHRKSRRPRAGA